MRREHIDHELPWGYWLRAQLVDGKPMLVDDETGERWATLRQAFWCGRLGMPDGFNAPPDAQLELLHAVLALRARRGTIDSREERSDLFEGSWLFRANFLDWLGGVGILTAPPDVYHKAELTPEGWSALAMLHATRPDAVKTRRPSGMTVQDLVSLGLGPDPREERLAEVERVVAGWDAAFLRQVDAGRHSVVLVERGRGPVPTRQTVWALAFAAERERDDFYEWLCVRLDRWHAWSEHASSYNSRELTHKLLVVLASSLQPSGIDRPAMVEALGRAAPP
ncbi:hypothetical protein SAMN06297144_1185 [Sphingomonas guangdongensis]|uniref:Uncharacterized protein n=1 Tax=Sphingomonas guangdongensis TaxID=1141890 RepID=A0A285QFI1_9SPHN|nr:hypothetical protein [Sphingomonas guangdongensis]SOB80680.1 hypothetical protein SAMN06297144_1185 [Sphingomonas guangdongensis]